MVACMHETMMAALNVKWEYVRVPEIVDKCEMNYQQLA